MSSEKQQGSIKLLEEFFKCPICLDLLKNPVTTPCGHNFCLQCIKQGKSECAKCRFVLNNNIQFNINTDIKNAVEEMVKMSDEEITMRYFNSNKKENMYIPLSDKKQSGRLGQSRSFNNCTKTAIQPISYRVKRLASEIGNVFNSEKASKIGHDLLGMVPKRICFETAIREDRNGDDIYSLLERLGSDETISSRYYPNQNNNYFNTVINNDETNPINEAKYLKDRKFFKY